MKILGLAIMTEASAVLIDDGVVVAASEEERFSRNKHQGGMPYGAIQWILDSQGLTLSDIDHVAVYWDPWRLGFRARYLASLMFREPSILPTKLRRALTVWKGNQGKNSGYVSVMRVRANLHKAFGHKHDSVHFLDHHLSHAASAYFGSGWDNAGVLVLDGAGEEACTSLYSAKGDSFHKIESINLPHSVGQYYSAVTGYLGFKMMDSEYKVMGLSPYGDPSGSKWIRENFLVDVGESGYALRSGYLDYHRGHLGDFSGRFADHFGPPRKPSEPLTDHHRDVAASAQAAFEDVVLRLARRVRRECGSKRLVIAGGCGLNCIANGKVILEGIFDEIYVPPVPHDAGGALGAAMLLHQNLNGERPQPIRTAQFGPGFDTQDIQDAIDKSGRVQFEHLSEQDLIERTAQCIDDGGVVAWFQGRSEYGPRALGNRSFLADPRRESAREDLNRKIKKREPFRPFAPSVKAEAASEFFEIDQPSPFMTIIVPVRPEKRSIIPAVTHIDGSARPQTVEKDINPRYWAVLDAFERRSGVPVLLNTSFNIQEPIVCSPKEAIETFLRSEADALAIGDFWVTKPTSEAVVSDDS